jgi:hypothetical protein
MPDNKVTIIFDGLMLFCHDQKQQRCEIKVHTAAEGHRMKIRAEAFGEFHSAMFCRSSVKELGQFSLHLVEEVEGEGQRRIANDAVAGKDYGLLLDLEALYHPGLKLRPNNYEASILLHHGVIGAGDQTGDCFLVVEDIFNRLDFDKILRPDWEALKKQLQMNQANSICTLPTFAKEAKAVIPLKAGQTLKFVHGAEQTDVFPELKIEHGRDYEITIEYNDAKPATSLTDCVGFAHHCKAFELKEEEPVFGLYFPNIVKSMDEEVEPDTYPGCCISCRIRP